MSDYHGSSRILSDPRNMGKFLLIGILLLMLNPGKPPWTGTLVTYIIAILLEAIPFILIGALLSGAVSVFLPEGILPRIAQKLGHWGIPAVMGLSFVFPVCECGVVSVAKGLLRKKLPLRNTIVFLLAAPILNPIVLLSTVIAFQFDYRFAFARFIGALFVSVPTALLLSRNGDADVFTDEFRAQMESGAHYDHDRKLKFRHKLKSLFSHSRTELFDMIPYLMMGVTLAAMMQTFLGTRILSRFGQNPVVGTASMMTTAFTLSLCSEADAFVGRTFYGAFSFTAVMGFLVLGPMLDIKLLLMYRTVFKKRFILMFAAAVVVLTAIYTLILGIVL